MDTVAGESLARYFEEIGKIPRIAREEEPSATQETLITANLRLVVHIAKRYSRDAEDLLEKIQDGNEGLVRAAAAFDPLRGCFSVCAAFHIRSGIRRRRTDDFGGWLNKRDYSSQVTNLEGSALVLAAGASSDDPASTAHLLHTLQEVGSCTTPKQQEVVVGRLLGKTLRQIAGETGKAYQTIQHLEREALKNIKKCQEKSYAK